MDREKLAELVICFTEAFNREDLDGVMSNYSDEAVFLPPNAPAVLGKEASRYGCGASAEQERTIQVHETRRNSMIQFVSHVFPTSGEYVCSQRADVGVMCDQVYRVRIGFPLSVSSE